MEDLRSNPAAPYPSLSGRLLEFSPQPVGPAEAARVPVGNVRLWFGALGGPVAWAIHLMVMYPLVEIACRFETSAPLYAASVVLFGAAALAGLTSWLTLRLMRGRNGATVPRRVRFMASFGAMAAVLFMVFIVGGTLPVFFDDPCQLQGRRRPTLLPHL
jgi:hypothetical protein